MIKRFLIGLLMLGVLTGCVYDEIVPENCPEEENARYHLSFVLNSTSGGTAETKATAGGTDIGKIGADILVKNVDLFFYTGDGNPQGVGKQNRYTITTFKQTVSASQTANIANQVHDFAVELPFRPYVMLVTANLDDAQAAKLRGKTLAEARALVFSGADASWAGSSTNIEYNSTVYSVMPFRMSSSTYVKSGLERCEVVIGGQYVWDNADDAKAHPIPVYIDRMAAKVNVVAPDPVAGKILYDVPIVTQYEGIKTQVEILGWGINGLNKQNYCYKKIDTGWSFDSSTWGVEWNEPAKFRTHWAEDPNYTNGTYPKDYGEILGGAVTMTGCDLQYLSWNQLAGSCSTAADKTANALYCLENTADGSILSTVRSDNQLFPKTTHVLVKAKLNFAAGSAFVNDPADYLTETNFYRHKGVFYTIKNILEAVVADQKSDGIVLYKDSAHTIEASASDFVLTHLYGEIMYPAVNGTLYDGSGNAVDADVWKNVRIDGFMEGLFYYKIPIEHLEPAPSPLGAKYPTAQYGVVRNHNYIITLTDKLAGIGTGIVKKDEPIIPVTEDRDYMVSVQVTVGNWKQFENRFVFVDPSGMLITNGQVLNRWEDEGDPSNNDWTGNGWYF